MDNNSESSDDYSSEYEIVQPSLFNYLRVFCDGAFGVAKFIDEAEIFYTKKPKIEPKGWNLLQEPIFDSCSANKTNFMICTYAFISGAAIFTAVISWYEMPGVLIRDIFLLLGSFFVVILGSGLFHRPRLFVFQVVCLLYIWLLTLPWGALGAWAALGIFSAIAYFADKSQDFPVTFMIVFIFLTAYYYLLMGFEALSPYMYGNIVIVPSLFSLVCMFVWGSHGAFTEFWNESALKLRNPTEENPCIKTARTWIQYILRIEQDSAISGPPDNSFHTYYWSNRRIHTVFLLGIGLAVSALFVDSHGLKAAFPNGIIQIAD
ncbi:uncharacterized protein NEMAJ01_0737 [Nematocida major]|uniref:uncharacterized protein n=1 Tax=Nematocida major TaxID=1912982 RepID=UPI0020075D09|nr:uncharacterized protein NEMAJ01_0737 [Nematocida major]KAH9385841.1 hypothetical protein NEMAJ01_0737 [Nematocida major]